MEEVTNEVGDFMFASDYYRLFETHFITITVSFLYYIYHIISLLYCFLDILIGNQNLSH